MMAKRQRSMLGVFVSPEIKAQIAAASKVSGRTLSREVEILVERALAYDRLMASTRSTMERIDQDGLEAEALRRGYVPLRDIATGKLAWLEPGHPAVDAARDLVTALATSAALREATGIRDAAGAFGRIDEAATAAAMADAALAPAVPALRPSVSAVRRASAR
jgi:hypothetical protein